MDTNSIEYIVRKIIEDNGKEILKEPVRFKGFLLDYANNNDLKAQRDAIQRIIDADEGRLISELITLIERNKAASKLKAVKRKLIEEAMVSEDICNMLFKAIGIDEKLVDSLTSKAPKTEDKNTTSEKEAKSTKDKEAKNDTKNKDIKNKDTKNKDIDSKEKNRLNKIIQNKNISKSSKICLLYIMLEIKSFIFVDISTWIKRIIIFFIIVGMVSCSSNIMTQSRYDKALALFESAQYEEARAAFLKMDDYKDSQRYIVRCEEVIYESMFAQINELIEAKEYEKAEMKLTKLVESKEPKGIDKIVDNYVMSLTEASRFILLWEMGKTEKAIQECINIWQSPPLAAEQREISVYVLRRLSGTWQSKDGNILEIRPNLSCIYNGNAIKSGEGDWSFDENLQLDLNFYYETHKFNISLGDTSKTASVLKKSDKLSKLDKEFVKIQECDEAELNKIIDEIFKSRFEFGEDDGMSDVTAVEESDADQVTEVLE